MRILILLLLPGLASADTLDGPGCVVEFPPSARDKAKWVAEAFLSRRDAAARWLGLEPSGRAALILAEDHAGMAASAPGAPSWAVAVTTGSTIVFRLDLVDREPAMALDLVLRHEAVHFALNRSAARYPHWFEEGLAVHHTGSSYLRPDTSLERIAAAGRLPRFGDADRLFKAGKSEAGLGYAMGERAVGTFVRRFGDEAVARLTAALARGATFSGAFFDVTGEPLADFERRWREEVTPRMPFWLFFLAENLELTLLCTAALLAALGYLRWRLRRERAMAALGGGDVTG